MGNERINRLKLPTSANIGNGCKGCELRTKTGDCHDFCPNYKQYKRKVYKQTNEYYEERRRIDATFSERNKYTSNSTIERLRKKRY